MKKKLLLATVLVSFAALSQAQQKGVGINTTTPAATLDVVADTTNNRMPDAVLVPRMTVDQLAAKDGAYAAAQNGALVFVTSGAGTRGKTANVTGTGFYYYDDPSSTWKALGGGGTVASSEFRLNLNQAASTAYDWSNSDFDYWEFTSGTQLHFPTPSSYKGRTIYVRNSAAGTIQLPGTNETQRPKGLSSITLQSAVRAYSDGATWYLVSGRN